MVLVAEGMAAVGVIVARVGPDAEGGRGGIDEG